MSEETPQERGTHCHTDNRSCETADTLIELCEGPGERTDGPDGWTENGTVGTSALEDGENGKAI